MCIDTLYAGCKDLEYQDNAVWSQCRCRGLCNGIEY